MNNLNKAFFILLVLFVNSFNVFCEDLGLTLEICVEDVIKKFEKNGFYKQTLYNELKYKFDNNLNLIFFDKNGNQIKIDNNSGYYTFDKNTNGITDIIEKKEPLFKSLRMDEFRVYSLQSNEDIFYVCIFNVFTIYCGYIIFPNKRIYQFANLSNNIKLFYIDRSEYNNPRIIFIEINKSGLDIFSLPYADISYYLDTYAISDKTVKRYEQKLWIWDKYILEPYGTAPALPR